MVHLECLVGFHAVCCGLLHMKQHKIKCFALHVKKKLEKWKANFQFTEVNLSGRATRFNLNYVRPTPSIVCSVSAPAFYCPSKSCG